MLDQPIPPPKVGEITVQDLKSQEFEQELTRSNWRYFHAQTTQSPQPGSGRRGDEESSPKPGNDA
jgi:hypothetical protein